MYSSIFYRYDAHHTIQETLVLLVIRKDPVIENFLQWKKRTDAMYLYFVYNNRVFSHIISTYAKSDYTLTITGFCYTEKQCIPTTSSVIELLPRPPKTRLNCDVLSRLSEALLMSYIQKNYCTESLEEYSVILMRHPLHELTPINRIHYTLTYMLQTGGTLINEFRRSILAKRDAYLLECLKRDQNSYVYAFADFLINYTPPAVTGRSSMRNFLLG